MKILLIYPPREHYIFGITPHVYVDADSGYYPPLGLLYISAYIEKNSAHEVRVLDSYTDDFSFEDLKKQMRGFKPDIVGIYISTYYIYDGILAARAAKEVSRDIKVVAGGPHVSLYPLETVRIPEVDYAMAGESEVSFLELVNCLETKQESRIGSIENALTKNTPRDKQIKRGRVEDLDSLPFPSRHLVDYRKYRSIIARKNPITTVMTSRGCPFNCYFCSNLESGHKVRYRSPKNVVDELEQVRNEYGIEDFLFFDELFTSNKQRAMDICDQIIKRGLKIRWHCRSRVDVLDEEMVRKMKKAGLRLIQFGIETGTARMQQCINKKLDLDKARKTIKMIYDMGVYTFADLMFGLPTETEEESLKTLEYAKSLKLDYVVFGMFHPIPGSYFYEQGLKENRFKDYWRELVVKNEFADIADHSWTGKDRAKYEQIMSNAYKSFYFRPGYIFSRFVRLGSLEQFVWQVRSAWRVFTKMFLKW